MVSAAGLLIGACKGDDVADSGTGTGSDTGTDTGGEERVVVDGFEYFPQSVASGDPRPQSVILWTRVEDPDAPNEDLELELELASDPEFTDIIGQLATVAATAAHDHCVKVRLTDVSPGQAFYYRFVYTKDNTYLASRVGQARTAPAPEDDVAARFAVVSCQDFSRWYNVHLALAEQDFDFVVHLGDYIYETTGDPDFQAPIPERAIEFDDKAGAIPFNGGEFYAAASLDNYRQLYRTYRTDRALQSVHERAPMIVTWDDHEFSNDCHGSTATYFGGTVDEDDVARRKAANQAWFEYMPIDVQGDPEFDYDPAAAFPGDLIIYRDFVWGKNLHLAMTDERTWRSDHPIREDAFPATVVVDEAAVLAELGELPSYARPYFDIDTWDDGSLRDALIAAAGDVGYDPAWITGDLDALFVNVLIQTIDPGGASLAPIPDADIQMMPRGVSYASMGKTGFYGSFGARALVVKPAYDLWTRLRYQETGGASEQVLGEVQEAWLLDTLGSSDRTWKVWGNEFAVSQVAIDVRDLAPAPFNQLYYLSLDLWDGHRNRRDAVLGQLAGIENMIAITGDIHAFYATTPFANGDPEQRIIELITSSITTQSFKEILAGIVATNPALASFPEAALLVEALDSLLTSSSLKTNPHFGYANSDLYGFVMIDLDATKLDATYHQIGRDYLFKDYAGNLSALLGAFAMERFRVNAGERELYRDFSGDWRRWDRDTQAWV
ncbi:Phosphodiesterase/alkaline phosphatase D [Enhygromyxa salina]|uniref:Phosphodiesterase/alkaline phosphatase D n=2 Tax=Enhygromyxa salina TaxID=215803 RepID=A0A0C1Z876_9BACT|nr:Phosphodiesterase/alkaline phosphatase D [Enhygromyxa salina]